MCYTPTSSHCTSNLLVLLGKLGVNRHSVPPHNPLFLPCKSSCPEAYLKPGAMRPLCGIPHFMSHYRKFPLLCYGKSNHQRRINRNCAVRTQSTWLQRTSRPTRIATGLAKGCAARIKMPSQRLVASFSCRSHLSNYGLTRIEVVGCRSLYATRVRRLRYSSRFFCHPHWTGHRQRSPEYSHRCGEAAAKCRRARASRRADP